VFGKTSLGNESAYNAGFAFVTYLARTYGEEKIAEISRNLSSFGAATIDGAIEKATGRPGNEVYAQWRSELERNMRSVPSPSGAAAGRGRPSSPRTHGEVVNPRQIQAPEASTSRVPVSRPRPRSRAPAAGQ